MKYADLTEPVRRIVDTRAERMAASLRIPIEDAREVIAARVTTTTHRPSHGTSH